jgi:quinol-cytochrome oxidoreductase complex cytochrome b subunit
MKHNILIDVAGWVGAVVLLLAYGLVSTRKTEGDSALYQLLNLAGSALLMMNSFYYGAYPSSGVNIVWIGIAIFALTRKKPSV